MLKYALYAKICISMNMQKYAKKICKKYANICICPMSLPQLHIYAKICKKYAKYVSMKFICIICTPHFADVFAQCMQSEPVGLHEGRKAAT